jgi:hypothetical protein
MCVQRFDDSLNSAIHITYRNSLRSSSMREPRDPLLKVVLNVSFITFFNLYFGYVKIIGNEQGDNESLSCFLAYRMCTGGWILG